MSAKHVIGSALIKGRRRDAETSKSIPPPLSTPQKSSLEGLIGSGLATLSETILDMQKLTMKDPIHHSVPPWQTVTPSPDVSRHGGQRHKEHSRLSDPPAVTRYHGAKLSLIASEEQAAVAGVRARARHQERLDRRAEGDGTQTGRKENAQDLRHRITKQRRPRHVPRLSEGRDESPGGAAELGVSSPERRSLGDAFPSNAANASPAAAQEPTPSKSPGKRLASPPRQPGGREQKKVRLSLAAGDVNRGIKSSALRPTAHAREISHGDLLHQEVWSFQGILSPSRGTPGRHRVQSLAQKTSVEHDEDEISKDDSDHFALNHSDPFRVSDDRLPGKRVAAQSEMGES